MNTLLWTLAVVGCIHTVVLIIMTISTGGLPPILPWARAADALYTLGICIWAVWLIASQKP